MKKNLTTIILILVFFIGLSLMLYPTVSDYWNSSRQSRAIAEYNEDVAKLSEADYDKLIKDARTFNENLLKKQNRYKLTDSEKEKYESLLNISGNGIMAYVDIPILNTQLPIYHGTDEDILLVAVGHLEWTSLPVGGENTHCVVSGHRGLPSAKLFSNLDKMSEGDIFILKVLNQTLTYEVDQIRIVLPDETDDLAIKDGEDYCTLVTCTPYGVNTHRLLVRGHRIENPDNLTIVSPDAMQIETLLVASAIAIPILLVLLIWILIKYRKHRKKQ